jgi:sterol desaturase/sphingolipid hydroxylase (fatty acid hydroxylase superfamily)
LDVTASTILERLQHPGIIFYWPYVLSAAVVSWLFLVLVTRVSGREAVKVMFQRHVWLTRTTLVDVLISMGYALLLAAPATALQIFVFGCVEAPLRGLAAQYALPVALHLPPWAEGVLLTLVFMLSVDLATYVVHRLLHAWELLWNVHAVHHSAESLTLFTTHRQHPLEPFLLNAARGALAAVGITAFYALFPNRTPPLTVAGLGAGFFVYMFTVNLQHSHIPVRYPRLMRWVLMSPHTHHIHHSRDERHHGKNYGVIFSLWDRIFGTYAEEDLAPGDLRFGLDPASDPFRHSLWRLYAYPLYAPLKRVRDRARASVL